MIHVNLKTPVKNGFRPCKSRPKHVPRYCLQINDLKAK